eukprot:gene9494-9570_t
MQFTLQMTLAALTIEGLFGYPDAIYKLIGHPVTWIGAAITWLEQRLNYGTMRRAKGVLTLGILLTASATPAFFLQAFILHDLSGLLKLAILSSALIAQRSLFTHVRAVEQGLSQNLEAGRAAVSMIVGRNTSVLDEAGVARAALESLAENFSDGIVAPIFWLCIFGLPGCAIYKAANTADSMIGHKNDRYMQFGWAAARFDDLINLPASRLAALWLVLAALVTRNTSASAAIKAVLRDAGKHRSPNAGWPEAAMAGALGLKLAGPRIYGSEMVEDAFMGDGRREATADDIARGLNLYRKACFIQALVIAGLAIAI